jgi:hypothetical protein
VFRFQFPPDFLGEPLSCSHSSCGCVEPTRTMMAAVSVSRAFSAQPCMFMSCLARAPLAPAPRSMCQVELLLFQHWHKIVGPLQSAEWCVSGYCQESMRVRACVGGWCGHMSAHRSFIELAMCVNVHEEAPACRPLLCFLEGGMYRWVVHAPKAFNFIHFGCLSRPCHLTVVCTPSPSPHVNHTGAEHREEAARESHVAADG